MSRSAARVNMQPVKIEWSPQREHQLAASCKTKTGCAPSAPAITQLPADPYLPDAFHRDDYHRLRAGPYRVM